MAIDHSILATMLNPLEADGYITRRRSFTDRRRHVVTVTPAGQEHLASAAQARRDAEAALFAALTARQREELRDMLITSATPTRPPPLTPTPTATTEAARLRPAHTQRYASRLPEGERVNSI